jgi:hypothetical protein
VIHRPPLVARTELRAGIRSDELAGYDACVAVIDSMYQDYHDCKGHPCMSLAEHLALLKISGSPADFVRSRLDAIALDAGQFAALHAADWVCEQLGLSRSRAAAPDWRASQIVRLRLASFTVYALVPFGWFLRPDRPGVVYG